MIINRQEDVTPAVLEVAGRTQEPRLREILSSLVRHPHGFIREVRLTEQEFEKAIGCLVALGQRTTDSHNETVLMAGSRGVARRAKPPIRAKALDPARAEPAV